VTAEAYGSNLVVYFAQKSGGGGIRTLEAPYDAGCEHLRCRDEMLKAI